MFKECTTWALSNECWRNYFHTTNGVLLVAPCTQLQYWFFHKGNNNSAVTSLLFKSNSYPKHLFLCTELLMETYQEIVLGSKWWSCVFFLIHWYDSFCHIIDANVTELFSDKDTLFLAVICFLQKIYGSMLLGSWISEYNVIPPGRAVFCNCCITAYIGSLFPSLKLHPAFLFSSPVTAQFLYCELLGNTVTYLCL